MIQKYPTLVELRRAVVREPSCNTVRLAFADELDEIGTPAFACHAKYIRTCIAHTTTHGPSWGISGGPLLNDRLWVNKRLRNHWRAWYTEAHPPEPTVGRWPSWRTDRSGCASRGCVTLYLHRTLDGVPTATFYNVNLVFERGFVSRFIGPYAAWYAYGDALGALDPISAVDLVASDPDQHLELYRHDNHRAPSDPDELRARWPRVTEWKLPT